MVSVDALVIGMVDAVVEKEFEESRRRIYNELKRRLAMVDELAKEMARSRSSKQENISDIYFATRRHHADDDELGRHL